MKLGPPHALRFKIEYNDNFRVVDGHVRQGAPTYTMEALLFIEPGQLPRTMEFRQHGIHWRLVMSSRAEVEGVELIKAQYVGTST